MENTKLETLSSSLSIGAIDCILDVKLELYSCKMVQSDKKQWKAYGGSNDSSNAHDRQPLSPPDDFLSISASPIGHSARMRHLSEQHSGSETDADDFVLLDSISKRTLFDLIGTLNEAYPDYDFSDVKSNSFSLIPNMETVIEAVDNKFYSTVNDYKFIREELWMAVENEIQPDDCRIYSFKSNYSGDPFSEDGCLWCLNFFFHNKQLKRLMLLSCRALSQNGALGESLFDLDD
ncbi:unnamed protein product [Nippostrongylus brasiliensis]|uniref:Repressor of RNA polymerase III transcription MAF1 n=1 Tax=Nippostrongylus brasiliensis TaxID=27835 RepID=A0A3P7AUM8_NIPBR|nr:unnamed protein product [Nippostrongylus brasiliensis]